MRFTKGGIFFMNTNVDANGKMNWHTRLRVSAGFCVALGVLRIAASFFAISFTEQRARQALIMPGDTFSVSNAAFYGTLIIILISVWQIFAGAFGVRHWGEPKQAFSIAMVAGILAVADSAMIIGTSVLFVQRTFFSAEAIHFGLTLLPLVLVFAGSIAVFSYAHAAYTYALQARKTLINRE